MPRVEVQPQVNVRNTQSPEREMGASPPVFMPAIMGWISQEEQRQRATDLVEAAAEISPTGRAKKRNNT